MLVLVCNGDNDVLIPNSRSWEILSRISNAQLVIYPRGGHGFLYQYADLVAKHINLFLDGTEFEDARPKL
jgi:pimeloyl-ACP methyl ester carboxylesterase